MGADISALPLLAGVHSTNKPRHDNKKNQNDMCAQRRPRSDPAKTQVRPSVRSFFFMFIFIY